MLQRLRKHGAWYDTRNHACGDHHGYLTMSAQDIKPGQRYVLYLWSASRDDLEPDRRIVFEAQTGITDLGAIVLEPPR